MKVQIIRSKATVQQVKNMLKTLETYIKLAVDIERDIIAGGGVLHADCEAVLIDDGSQQENIWGADWIPVSQELRFEALINIRPTQGNKTMTIQDSKIRERIEKITRRLLGDVECG